MACCVHEQDRTDGRRRVWESKHTHSKRTVVAGAALVCLGSTLNSVNKASLYSPLRLDHQDRGWTEQSQQGVTMGHLALLPREKDRPGLRMAQPGSQAQYNSPNSISMDFWVDAGPCLRTNRQAA